MSTDIWRLNRAEFVGNGQADQMVSEADCEPGRCVVPLVSVA